MVAARFPGYPMQVAETTVSGPGAAAVDHDGPAGPGRRARGRGRHPGPGRRRRHPAAAVERRGAVPGRRAPARCPVVSAIGHEGDRPLCDEVADLRCGTPSLAAGRGRARPGRAPRRAGPAGGTGLGPHGTIHFDRADRRLAAVDTAGAVSAGIGLAAGRLSRTSDQLRPAASPPPAGRGRPAAGRHRPGRPGPAPARAGRRPARRRRVEGAAVRRRLDQATARLDADRRHLEALSPARVLDRGYAVVRTAGRTGGPPGRPGRAGRCRRRAAGRRPAGGPGRGGRR